jgi:hypothetical protein
MRSIDRLVPRNSETGPHRKVAPLPIRLFGRKMQAEGPAAVKIFLKPPSCVDRDLTALAYLRGNQG